MYDKLSVTAKFIQEKIGIKPKIGIILGSGLGSFVEQVENPVSIPYSEVPNFGKTSVEGHDGRIIAGQVDGIDVIILQGRLHVYEGYDIADIVFPTRTLAVLGIEKLVLTNASGGVNLDYKAGDLILIDDHINMMGTNPLIGPNIKELGPRFPDMTMAYDPELKEVVKKAAKNIGYNLKSGVYTAVSGPTYETPAEVRMVRILGGDLVGMSTVPESIAANHFGMKVCGVSCVTNMAAGVEKGKLSHDEVKEQAQKVMHSFTTLLKESVKLM